MLLLLRPGAVRGSLSRIGRSNLIPALLGHTVRHRLNRSTDRQLNQAPHTIVRTRMMFGPATKDYVARRTTEGKSLWEIRRYLKRVIARQLFRKLQSLLT